MSYVEWKLRGPQIATCNCAWGCPCQFYGVPTNGNCRGAFAMRVDNGHFRAVSLDDLTWVELLAWPGAIHEGNGEALAIIDERASPEQRNALLTILSGQEQEPGATYFNVLASTITKMHEPIFRRIDFEADLAACTGRFSVHGIVDSNAQPVRNPITNKPHRMKLGLQTGFEFLEAEFGSGTTKADGAIPLNWSDRHAHLAMIDIGPYGPHRAAV